MKRIGWLLVGAALVAGCAQKAAEGGAASGRVAIAVTEKGFVPATVTVAAGQPVTLVVTRQTAKTCATELVVADYDIRRELPLGQAVDVTFTPKQAGEIRYACGMGMLAGKVVAR